MVRTPQLPLVVSVFRTGSLLEAIGMLSKSLAVPCSLFIQSSTFWESFFSCEALDGGLIVVSGHLLVKDFQTIRIQVLSVNAPLQILLLNGIAV